MTAKMLVPDTNVLLNSIMFDAIPWKSIVEGHDVDVVITITVIDELDRLKTDTRQPKRQSKARELLSKLGSLLADSDAGSRASLASGVNLLIGSLNPHHDWNALGLDPRQMDDRILADVLALRAANPDAGVTLMTSDLGMMLRAKGRELSVIAPPQSIDSSQGESEEERLQRELNRLKNRQPRLVIDLVKTPTIRSGATSDARSATWQDIVANLERLTLGERERVEHFLPYESEPRRRLVGHDDLRTAARYHLEDFSDAVLVQQLSELGVVLHLDIVLRNAGSMPATHVELYLTFPDGSVAIGPDDLNEYYGIPTTEGVPWSQDLRPRSYSGFDSMAHLSVMPSRESLELADISHQLQLLRREPPQGPFYEEQFRDDMPDFPIRGLRYNRRERHEGVSFESRRLSHHKPWVLPTLLVFLPPAMCNGFQIAYSMYCDELLEPIEGRLGVSLVSSPDVGAVDAN